jgi:hypothetical protein
MRTQNPRVLKRTNLLYKALHRNFLYLFAHEHREDNLLHCESETIPEVFDVALQTVGIHAARSTTPGKEKRVLDDNLEYILPQLCEFRFGDFMRKVRVEILK